MTLLLTNLLEATTMVSHSEKPRVSLSSDDVALESILRPNYSPLRAWRTKVYQVEDLLNRLNLGDEEEDGLVWRRRWRIQQ
jgi:hypothetical protein